MVTRLTAMSIAGNDLTYFPRESPEGHTGELWINHGDDPHALMLSMDHPQINAEMVEAFLGETVEDFRAMYETTKEFDNENQKDHRATKTGFFRRLRMRKLWSRGKGQRL